MKNPTATAEGRFLKVRSSDDKEAVYVRRELVNIVTRNGRQVALQNLSGTTLTPLMQAEFESDNAPVAFARTVLELVSI